MTFNIEMLQHLASIRTTSIENKKERKKLNRTKSRKIPEHICTVMSVSLKLYLMAVDDRGGGK